MNIQTNSGRRVLALALVLAMLSALLCGCAQQDEENSKCLEGAPAGLSEASEGNVLEVPSFNVIGGNDDPFADIPDDPGDDDTSDTHLDLRGMLDDPEAGNYTLEDDPTYPETNPEDPGPDEPAGPTMARELMGHQMTITVTVLDTECYPVNNALVEIGEFTGRTNAHGEVKLKIKSGVYEMYVTATGYTPYYEELAISTSDIEISIQIANSNKIRVLLDSADLHPYVTKYEQLEDYLDSLFSVLFHDGMDTYDKVIACYDYIIDHMTYKSPRHWVSAKAYWPCAHQSFQEGIGTCNCYSAMFTVMMRHIGLDCSIVTGYTSAVNGGYTSHDWTTINIGGKYYIFDCQVEDAIAERTASKEVKYVRFCLAEPHAKYVYRNKSRESCIKTFEEYLLANGHFVDE